MKTFKQIDFFGQVVLISTFTVASLINLDYNFRIGYYVVGGWQLASILVHIANKWYCSKGSKRYKYSLLSCIVVLLMLTVFVIPGAFYLLFVMLFAATVMAMYYAAL